MDLQFLKLCLLILFHKFVFNKNLDFLVLPLERPARFPYFCPLKRKKKDLYIWAESGVCLLASPLIVSKVHKGTPECLHGVFFLIILQSLGELSKQYIATHTPPLLPFHN